MSDKIVDAIAKGNHLDAEAALKDTMKAKVAAAIETKKVEVAKGIVNNHIDATPAEVPAPSTPDTK
jgi:dsRNA-specific ribonuclease